MKKISKLILSFILVISLLSATLSVSAAQPKGYWPYFTAYTSAVESGNVDKILSTGNALLAFYSKFSINKDIAGMSYNIYLYRYQTAVFEKKGDYDAAIANAKMLVYNANYMGFTDMAIAAAARIEKLDPMTEVYAATNNSASTVYFGAKNEPTSGTYYGRVSDMSGTTMKNAAKVSSEAIVSFYVHLGAQTAKDFSWLIGPYDNGKHVIHIALNFPEEAATAQKIISGTYDSNIKTTLGYLASLDSPVFLRIGGEMNLWEMDVSLFKNAYIHVAKLAQSIAPQVALVWSPNYVGSWGSSVADFYPGDTYVDWVGVSLYTNSVNTAGQTDYSDDSMYFGRGAFADCILSMKEVDKLAEAHNKPVIVTEGGTGIVSSITGMNYESKAATQITKMYSALNMVYPNIKAIVYFDTDPNVDTYKYAMSNSSIVSSSYDAAITANPTLISASGKTAPSYVKLSAFSASAGSVYLAAYSDTLYSNSMTVTYYLSGNKVATKTSLPYSHTLSTDSLTAGKYEFAAVFNDGAGYIKTKTYTLNKLMNGTVTFTDGYNASATVDVPSPWAQEEVGLSIDLNLVPASMQCNFTQYINRQNFCRLVINLIEQKTGKIIDEVLQDNGKALNYSAFSDTTDKNILAANALGIVNGRGNNVFDCTSGISRQEAATMLKNTADFLGIKATGTKPIFSDTSSFSTWAVDPISFVSAATDQISQKVVMGGIGNNMFSPMGPYTYQQAFITMLRLYRS